MDEEYLNSTSYCGLYCGSCPFGTGAIPDLARDLRKELRSCRFNEIAETIPFESLKKYPDCYEVLGEMVKLRCNGCRNGMRSRYCDVAKCAIRKKYTGCWECDEFSSCKKLKFLEPIHGEAHKKNMRKIKKAGVKAWAEDKPLWYSPIRKK